MKDQCLVLLQVPKYFGLVKFFWTRPKIYIHFVFVPVTNILCHTKFLFNKFDFFFVGTKVFEEALNAVKFLG